MDRNLEAVSTEVETNEELQGSVIELSQVQLAIVGGGTGEVVFG